MFSKSISDLIEEALVFGGGMGGGGRCSRGRGRSMFGRFLVIGEMKILEVLEKIHRELLAKGMMGDDERMGLQPIDQIYVEWRQRGSDFILVT